MIDQGAQAVVDLADAYPKLTRQLALADFGVCFDALEDLVVDFFIQVQGSRGKLEGSRGKLAGSRFKLEGARDKGQGVLLDLL